MTPLLWRETTHLYGIIVDIHVSKAPKWCLEYEEHVGVLLHKHQHDMVTVNPNRVQYRYMCQIMSIRTKGYIKLSDPDDIFEFLTT